MKKKYQCLKLNTYLVTLILSEWGYCVSIEIKPYPNIQSHLKSMSAVMLYFLEHICEYRMTWLININFLKMKL